MKKSNQQSIKEYLYHLPKERIALHPLQTRDQSKLLVWKNGDIDHHIFRDIASFIPQNSLMIFNDTRVIPARLIFHKQTGAKIEIFLLDPVEPSPEIAAAMQAGTGCIWRCLIGNKKKWKSQERLIQTLQEADNSINFSVEYVDQSENLLKFSWTGDDPFVKIIELSGETPLPPYLHRPATSEDKSRYQTIYSRNEGAVAAPTAGLHFTDQVFKNLYKKHITTNYITLHVSAGTFKPVKEKDYTNHPMHAEQIRFSIENINNIIKQTGPVIAVGTTTLRSLESVYWYGVKLVKSETTEFFIEKQYPYRHNPTSLPSRKDAISAILSHMENQGLQHLNGTTEIFIYPGYEFQVCSGLVTNFHLPGSTLLLLVAAFTHNNWKNIYQEALDNNYRFLSYGDSSLLLR